MKLHIPRVLCALAAVVMLVASCARNPVTGRTELSLISEEDEIELGRQAAQQTMQTIGLVDDQGLQTYVQSIGASIATRSERPNLPWTFRVLDDPTPNAFAFPGGFIFVTRGMLALMDSEAELASVLGHEIGHVTARHAVNQISQAQVAQIGLGIGSVLIPGLGGLSGVLGTGLELIFLENSRDDEREADALGFGYALERGYDVREMDDVFVSLDQIQRASGRSPLPTWASTHPSPGDRVAAIRQRIDALEGPVASLNVGREPYMRQIDGLAYGDDPRNGFVDDGVFYHPELAFRIAFPQGWDVQNLANAVVAGPSSRDAAVEVSLVSGSPQQAASAFLNRQGIRAGETRSTTINGLPAVVSTFQASTQGGNVRGISAFVSHRGDTYAVIGLSTAGRFNAYQSTLQQVIGSFGPIRDSSVLAVQPYRLDAVQLAETMSVGEFLRRHPSDIGNAEVLLLNQIRSNDARLPGGEYFKRVIRGRAEAASL